MSRQTCQYCGGNGKSSKSDRFYPKHGVDQKCFRAIKYAADMGVEWVLARHTKVEMWARRLGAFAATARGKRRRAA